jgi:tRNA G46 methylase TrmB
MGVRFYSSALTIIAACLVSDAAFVTVTSTTTMAKQRQLLRTKNVSLSPRCLIRLYSTPTDTTDKTQYTIDETVCPPTRPHLLNGAVTKACASLDTFLERKPIARHTQQAFDSLVELMGRPNQHPAVVPIVLDSGCGTGRSTELLGELYPDCVVIGVDRSFARLSKKKKTNKQLPNHHHQDDGEGQLDDRDDIILSPQGNTNENNEEEEESKRPFCQKMSNNTYLVRAELVDFWRCCQQQSDWTIAHHYLLYPNPYPTHTRLTQRWYAHPSFPLILKLKSQSITVRSNWKGYLEEFARAVEIASDYYDENVETNGAMMSIDDSGGCPNPAMPYLESARQGPIQRTNLTIAWTNFERKYDQVGEPTYELRLEARGK